MAAPPLANTTEFVLWCLNVKRPAHFYFDRLGISNFIPEHKRNVRGTPKFEGAAAFHCSALFRATCNIVNDLAEKHETKDAIRTAVSTGGSNFIDGMTQPLLDDFGRAIWSSSEPFMTQIKETVYPRHLVYNVVADSEKIRVLLACWILDQVIERRPASDAQESPSTKPTMTKTKIPRTGGTHPPRPNTTRRKVVNLSICCDMSGIEMVTEGSSQYHTDTESYDRATEEHQEDLRASFDRSAQPGLMVPVARMVSTQDASVSTKTSHLHSRGIIASTKRQDLSSITGVSQNKDNITSSNARSVCAEGRTVKRRDFSQQDLTNKRQKLKSPMEVITSVTGPAAQGNREVTPSESSSSGPSHTSLSTRVLVGVDNEPSTCNFPNISRTYQENKERTEDMSNRRQPLTLQQSNPSRSSGQNAAILRSATQVDPPQSQRRNASGPSLQGSDKDEVDSVQDSPPPAHRKTRSSKRKQKKPSPPSLVLPIKLTPPTSDLEDRRQRLASKLLDVLSAGLERPNVPLIADTVDLLDSISKADRQRLIEIYKDEHKDYQGTLTRWRLCLSGLLEFCNLTGFRGNETTRMKFVDTLPSGPPFPAIRAFIHTRGSIAEWRSEPDFSVAAFSADLASVLFNAASWEAGMMRESILEEMAIGFNEELMSWFSTPGH